MREIRRLIEPLQRKVQLVASKAVVKLVKDSIGLQGIQLSVLHEEVTDEDTEHMQPGGLTHKPFAGAEGVFLSIGGERGDGVVICVSDRRHRPKELEDGETCVYNEGEHQSTILLKQDGAIEITAAAGGSPSKVVMTAEGDITIMAAGSVLIGDGAAESMVLGDAMAAWLEAHTHPTAMGPSGPPIEAATLPDTLSTLHKLDE